MSTSRPDNLNSITGTVLAATVVSVTTTLLISALTSKKVDPALKRELESRERKLNSALTQDEKIAALTNVVDTQSQIIKDVGVNQAGVNLGKVGAGVAAAGLWYHSNYKTSYNQEKGLSVEERPSWCNIL